jgi:hypothetical protein
VTIHYEHPFLEPEERRRPGRRLRGRLPSPVTVWASVAAGTRAGLTVSSLVVADGDPPRLLGLLDEESDLWAVAQRSGRVAVSLLGPDDGQVADVHAGLAPSPGGAFRSAAWTESEWGPVLSDRPFVGTVLDGDQPRRVGWSLVVELVVDHVALESDIGALAYRRGRYLPIADGR